MSTRRELTGDVYELRAENARLRATNENLIASRLITGERAEKAETEVERLRAENARVDAQANQIDEWLQETVVRAERAEAEIERLRGRVWVKQQRAVEAEAEVERLERLFKRHQEEAPLYDRLAGRSSQITDRISDEVVERAMSATYGSLTLHDLGDPYYKSIHREIVRAALEAVWPTPAESVCLHCGSGLSKLHVQPKWDDPDVIERVAEELWQFEDRITHDQLDVDSIRDALRAALAPKEEE